MLSTAACALLFGDDMGHNQVFSFGEQMVWSKGLMPWGPSREIAVSSKDEQLNVKRQVSFFCAVEDSFSIPFSFFFLEFEVCQPLARGRGFASVLVAGSLRS